jgi:hypothetical protein
MYRKEGTTISKYLNIGGFDVYSINKMFITIGQVDLSAVHSSAHSPLLKHLPWFEIPF